MYSNKLAVAVKANGKVLREFGENVYVPFGSEYSVLIKNLNSLRVQVRIWIDGTDVTDGAGLIIDGNRELELERFIKNGNLSEGNRFKFIERTAGIENGPRGVKIDDGLIRIEFQYERQPQPWTPNINSVFDKQYGWDSDYNRRLLGQTFNTADVQQTYGMPQHTRLVASSAAPSDGILRSMNMAASVTAQSAVDVKLAASTNDVGITVAGSHSTQQFQAAAALNLDPANKHTIVLHILGETEQGKAVVKAVTTKTKQKCETCGYVNKATSKFCTECGTSLTIY